MGNHQFAIQDFNSAIKCEPDFADSFFYRGVSKLKSRRYMDAIDDFNTAIDKGSENPGIYDGLGCCFHALKDFDKAIEVRLDVDKILEYGPSD